MAVSVRTAYEQKKRTRFRFKAALGATLAVGLALGFAYLHWEKRLFEFKEVVLEGAVSLSRAELLGGEGPISFFSSVALDHPVVATAAVSKDYFRQTLHITLRERERYGVWCAKDACFWFDEMGVVFSPAPSTSGGLVRLVSDRTGRPLTPGEPALPAERFLNMKRAFDLFERAELSVSRLVIEEGAHEEAYAELLLGPRIFVSFRNDPTFAYEPLVSLTQEFSKLSYIDLRVGQRLFLGYK